MRPRLSSNRLLAIAILVSLPMLTSCGNNGDSRSTSPDATSGTNGALIIRSGTSFGECTGYCFHELTIENGRATYVVKTWDGSMPALTTSVELGRGEWARLQSLAKPETLDDIPPVLGCPDCADGGAEWVEIETRTATDRVTFEYAATVGGLDELLPLLRELRARLGSM